MGAVIGFFFGLFVGAGCGVIVTAVLVAAKDAAEYERKEAGMPGEERDENDR